MQIAFTIKLDKYYNQSTKSQIVSNQDPDISLEDINKDITVDEAHTIATKVQELVIRRIGASRVIIHTEPL